MFCSPHVGPRVAARRPGARRSPDYFPLETLSPLRTAPAAARGAGSGADRLNSETLSVSLSCSLLFSRSALATLTGVSRASRPSAELGLGRGTSHRAPRERRRETAAE